MRKITQNRVAILLIAFLISGVTFAQERPFRFSLGGGFLAGMATSDVELFENSGIRFRDTDFWSFGGWVFADARFVELSAGFTGGPWDIERGVVVGDDRYEDFSKQNGMFTAIDLNLLGKYPFVLGNSNTTLFPLLGVGYNLVTSARLDGERFNNPSDLSVFKMNLGVGSDFALSENMFLRLQLLGHYRFASDAEQNYRIASSLQGTSHGGFGGTLRVAIGFKL